MPQKRSAQILSFDCRDFRISPTDSKVRTYFLQRNTHTTGEKKLLSSFHLNGHTLGFHPQTQKVEPTFTA